tara:strand:+ start:1339 stop:1560 length:222 start_codon:yes stop_codon:yes gene_type:complete
MIVQKIIINAAVKLLAKQFKLEKILKYVEQPNELDNTVENHENRIKNLEALAHPKREFVSCSKCQSKIEEKIC